MYLYSFTYSYYEGKEYEVKKRNYKPGKISDELREALGIINFMSYNY
jgi:lysozyme family protein